MDNELVKENFEILKEIYSKMGDEKSKYIFNNRLLYSISGQTEYIKNIIKTTDYGSEFTSLLNSNKNIYLFGAGIWGSEITKIWGDCINGVLDNNECKIGGMLNGVKIYAANEIISDEFEGIVIIATRKYNDEIFHQLLELGMKEQNIINAIDFIEQAEEEQYFSLNELPHVENEVFVDVGSLDAKTAIQFTKWSRKYKKIYCFEPDKKNIKMCINNIDKYGLSEKIEMIKSGAWSQDGELYINSQGNGMSSVEIDGNGKHNDKIQVNKLDTVLRNEKVTFIKIDIEGAELEAICGSKKIIMEQKPKLAISIYHKPEDIIVLINLIMKYNHNYCFYLRHHSIVSWDTVLYAI